MAKVSPHRKWFAESIGLLVKQVILGEMSVDAAFKTAKKLADILTSLEEKK